MSKKPNIRDLARAAGVSTKTVSRVTNGEANVAASTARRVQQAIEELGYAANPLARSLRTGRDEAIALVVPTIADPFFSALVDAVEGAARDVGLFLIVASSGRSGEQEQTVLTGVLHRSVQGLIVVPSGLDYGAVRLPIGRTGIPVVFVDRSPIELAADARRPAPSCSTPSTASRPSAKRTRWHQAAGPSSPLSPRKSRSRR